MANSIEKRDIFEKYLELLFSWTRLEVEEVPPFTTSEFLPSSRNVCLGRRIHSFISSYTCDCDPPPQTLTKNLLQQHSPNWVQTILPREKEERWTLVISCCVQCFFFFYFSFHVCVCVCVRGIERSIERRVGKGGYRTTWNGTSGRQSRAESPQPNLCAVVYA